MKNILASNPVVDVNCMIGRGVDRLWKFDTADQLEAQLDAFHIRRAVVWHAAANNWNVPDGNAMLLRDIAGRDRLRPCLVATPHFDTAEMPAAARYRQQLASIRPAALRLFPRTAQFSLSPFFAGELLEIANRFRLPLMVDYDELEPAALAEAAGTFPAIPWMILNSMFRHSRMLFPLLRQCPNVHVVTSFFDSNLLEEIVAKFGPERVLFGSGMPQVHPGPMVAVVTYADVPEADKAAILGGNWARIERETRWT
jgi:predicted TIM-barrel fold metal-dependent hydrolase